MNESKLNDYYQKIAQTVNEMIPEEWSKFKGSDEIDNLVPMNATLNRSESREYMEEGSIRGERSNY